jgi:hypothetical protein
MLAAAADTNKLQKAFLLMMCATLPGEMVAARDAVLRIAGCGPYELAVRRPQPSVVGLRTMEMSNQILGWDGITPQLTPTERRFIKGMTTERHPPPDRVEWLERIFARMFGDEATDG